MRLKDLREDKELLQKDLAKMLNTTQQYYSTFEQNYLDNINIKRIILLSKYYNVSTDYILGLKNEKR